MQGLQTPLSAPGASLPPPPPAPAELEEVVDYLKDVEGRHATSAMQTRESVRLASEQVQKSMIAELRAGDVWWKRMAWVVGIAAALSGTGTVVRIAQAMMGKP